MEWYSVDWEDLAAILSPVLFPPAAGTAPTGGVARAQGAGRRRLLDLGCGTSRLAPQLAAAVSPLRLVVGADASPAAIAAQRRLPQPQRRAGGPRLRFDVADAASAAEGRSCLPYRDGAFGAVLEKGLLDALLSAPQGAGSSRASSVTREAWRVVAPGGLLLSISQGRGLENRLAFFDEDMALKPTPIASRELPGLPPRGVRIFALWKPVSPRRAIGAG